MTLPRWRILTAVPQTWQARLEIAKAIRTLAVEDEEDKLQRRHADIGAIRRDLEQLTQSLREVCRECDPRARSYVQKYSPDQPRVPAGNSDGGQWTNEGGADPEESTTRSNTTINGNSKPSTQYSAIDTGTRTDAIAGVSGVQVVQAGRPGYPIDLSEEEQLGGHAISQHVGKSPSYLLSLINDDEVLAERHGDLAQGLKEGSFPSLEAANKLVNSTVSKNQATADLVAQGLLPGAQLDASFASPTGYEAYARTERSTPYIRDTYGVRVIIKSDKNAEKGYRVVTAFPMNF